MANKTDSRAKDFAPLKITSATLEGELDFLESFDPRTRGIVAGVRLEDEEDVYAFLAEKLIDF